MGLRPAADALSRELSYDDGKVELDAPHVDTLAGERERLPELSYEGTGGDVDGQQAFTFATNEAGCTWINSLSSPSDAIADSNAPSAADFRTSLQPGPISSS